MKKKRRVFIISICVLVLIAIAIYVVMTNIQNGLQSLSTAQIKEIDIGRVPNGVFTGQFSTMPVSARVEITVHDGKITDIKLLEHNNGQGKPAEAIIGQVLENQTLEVDVIAGATYSSKVILKAIEDALDKASSN
jgi:uncharacterized protein with FMN-binding domain